MFVPEPICTIDVIAFCTATVSDESSLWTIALLLN